MRAVKGIKSWAWTFSCRAGRFQLRSSTPLHETCANTVVQRPVSCYDGVPLKEAEREEYHAKLVPLVLSHAGGLGRRHLPGTGAATGTAIRADITERG
jgi:hypothetical protein